MIALLAIVCNTSKAQVEGSPLESYWDDDIKAYVISEYAGLAALQEINLTDSWSEYDGISIYIQEGESDNFIESYNNEHEEEQWNPLTSTDDSFKKVHFYCRASHYNDYVEEGQGSGPLYLFGTDNGSSDSSPFLISSADDIKELIDLLKFLYYDSYAFSYYVNLENLSTDSPFQDSYFLQTCDLDLGTISEGIGTQSHPFSGTYDGGSFNINVNVEANDDNGLVKGALFNETENATIKNLSITGKNTDEHQYGTSAGIVGNATDNITLVNCIVNVELGNTYQKYGLIGSCSESYAKITDCINKGAADLDQFPSSSDFERKCFSWTDAIGEGTYASPLLLSTLEELKSLSEDENANPWIEEYGLCYELTGDCNLLDYMLVDPNGRYTNPDGVTNNDYYIKKFCGTLIGNYTYEESSSKIKTNNAVISGITDKAIFGTITGDSRIERIGFVNCYNADTKKVCIANEVSDGTLTIKECYGDGYFDFKNNSNGSANTIVDCYSRSYTPSPKIANFTQIDNSLKWSNGYLTYNQIETNVNSVDTDGEGSFIVSSESITTDAIPGPIHSNYPAILFQYDEYSSTPNADPRLKFKYNLVGENNVINVLTLRDITTLGSEVGILKLDDDEKIKYTEFNHVNYSSYTTYNIKGIRYLRKAHNDWESVCLPFAYKLSDIDSHFTAYTYSENGNEGAKFITLPKNTVVVAGQPVLFFNSGKDEGVNFEVSIYDPNGLNFDDLINGTLVTEGTDDGTFYGVLQTTGLARTEATKEFDEDCYSLGDSHYEMYVYKISGTNNGTDDAPSGNLLRCSETSWIYPYRTYLKIKDSGNLKSIVFSIDDDDEATGVTTTEAYVKDLVEGVFSIDGRKISSKNLKPGLYIMNGKKFAVK